MIRLENVTKIYRTSNTDVAALRDISCRIDEGEFVAVRGPSGCGKSTLLALIGGLDTPTSGQLEFAGQNLSSLSPAHRARLRAESIGFVFQLFHLLPYASVLDNVLVAANGPARAETHDRALKLLADFGLSERLKHRPSQLSIGERQRVAMARALLNQPRLILADEPTGNLDPENAGAVLDILSQFHRDGGTVLLVTHDAAATAYAGRTIRLRDGQLEEPGSVGSPPSAPSSA